MFRVRPHRLAPEGDAAGVVHEPVEDGIGKRRIADLECPCSTGSWLVRSVARSPWRSSSSSRRSRRASASRGASPSHRAAAGQAELARLTQTLALRIGRYLERQGLPERDAESSDLADEGLEAGPMEQVLGWSITYRIAIGPRQGRKVFTLQMVPACVEPFDEGGGKVAGFSLYACVAARATQRETLERLCRYVSRSAGGREVRERTRRRGGFGSLYATRRRLVSGSDHQPQVPTQMRRDCRRQKGSFILTIRNVP
jgi:hypothetical protein